MVKKYARKGLLAATVLLGLVPAAQAFDTGPHQDLTREVLSEIGFNQDANETVQLENWLTDYYSASPTIGTRSSRRPSFRFSAQKLSEASMRRSALVSE